VNLEEGVMRVSPTREQLEYLSSLGISTDDPCQVEDIGTDRDLRKRHNKKPTIKVSRGAAWWWAIAVPVGVVVGALLNALLN
jgi:hypothetical protein